MKLSSLVFLLIFNLISTMTFGVESKISRDMTSFSKRKVGKKVYDFSGTFPELTNIEIDARRKSKVELIINGEYPELKKIVYNGGFGYLKGDLTGKFLSAEKVIIACQSCEIDVDFQGTWKENCEFVISGVAEEMKLALPKNVPVKLFIKKNFKGRVILGDGWTKLKVSGSRRAYGNKALLDSKSSDRLIFNAETVDGTISIS